MATKKQQSNSSNKEKKKIVFDLSQHIVRLLLSEPFFAAVSRRVNKISTYAVPTAGIRFDPKRCEFELFYNPDYLAKLPDEQIRGILKHEFYHLIFGHVTSRLPAEAKSSGQVSRTWNISADLAINSYLQNELPENCCMPGVNVFKDYPLYQAADWYYKKLKEEIEKFKKDSGENNKGKGNRDNSSLDNADSIDDHSKWCDTAVDEQTAKELEEIKEVIKEKAKDIMRKAAEEASQSGSWGTISESIKRNIMDSLRSVIDWRKVLRWFIKASQRADKSNTLRRINKRYPYIQPGTKINRQANIAISIDQSGSVSDVLLGMFFTELNALSKFATFTVIPFDSEVGERYIYKWKKGAKNKKWERVLSGGTDFNAPTKYVNEHKEFDAHIILTDMCAPKPISSRCHRLWITNIEGASKPYFETNERVVIIEEKRQNK